MGRALVLLISIVILFVSWSVKAQTPDGSTTSGQSNSTAGMNTSISSNASTTASTNASTTTSVLTSASTTATVTTVSSTSCAMPHQAALILLSVVAGSILGTA
ncbi:hypothetical protein OJAV_G00166190 [Oryzias javanicus]|uniref:Uncharacterized protein n=1 Tax=Oryzias javanicus TaxID=123683 RepID=A0A3S2PU25_ORYJA|nr:hypothetical protein OJAV_G00166190 [Oryzias javanicus]